MCADACGTSATPSLIRFIHNLKQQQHGLVTRLSRAEYIADRILCDLEQLEDELGTGVVPNPGERRSARHREEAQALQLLRQEAQRGVVSLGLNPHADGSAAVRINEGKVFVLPPMLADLLAILSADTGQSHDDLVGWKTLNDVTTALGKKAAKKFRKHAVTQLIWRLRRELFRRGGVNPFLVQTNRRYGLRFALKRQITR